MKSMSEDPNAYQLEMYANFVAGFELLGHSIEKSPHDEYFWDGNDEPPYCVYFKCSRCGEFYCPHCCEAGRELLPRCPGEEGYGAS